MNKKILIGLIVVVIIVVIVVAAGIFLLGGLLKSPIDTSGVNPPTTLETEELLPAELAGNQLDNESVDTDYFVGTTITSAIYDGTLIFIIEADYEWRALETLNDIYEDSYGSGSGTRTKSMDWFQCDIDGDHVFFWKSGVWVFGVHTTHSEAVMEQVAEDFVEHLRTFS